jgi:hypothetical protein
MLALPTAVIAQKTVSGNVESGNPVTETLVGKFSSFIDPHTVVADQIPLKSEMLERNLASTNTAFKNTLRDLQVYPVCPLGKFLDIKSTVEESKCVDCPYNCEKCTSGLECVTCKIGFLKFEIEEGPFKAVACLPCSEYISNCESCANHDVCNKCKTGYTLVGTPDELTAFCVR